MKHRDLPLDQLSKNLMMAFEYWRVLGGEQLRCAWSDFDLMEIPLDVVPSTMVIDVFPDHARNRYRFWGSRMTIIHGREMTGMSPYEIEPSDMVSELRRQHDETRREKTASASCYNFMRHPGIDHVHSVLRLPLSDDGQTVSQIVVVTDMHQEDRDYMQSHIEPGNK